MKNLIEFIILNVLSCILSFQSIPFPILQFFLLTGKYFTILSMSISVINKLQRSRIGISRFDIPLVFWHILSNQTFPDVFSVGFVEAVKHPAVHRPFAQESGVKIYCVLFIKLIKCDSRSIPFSCFFRLCSSSKVISDTNFPDFKIKNRSHNFSITSKTWVDRITVLSF